MLAKASYEIRRRGWPWTEGSYQAIDVERSGDLVVVQRHPALGQIVVSTSYAPTFLPVWGNAATFSFEPMLERTLGVGQAVSWRVDYHF